MTDEIVIMKAPHPGHREVYLNRGRRYTVGPDGLIFGVDPADVASFRASGWRVVDRANSDEYL